MFSQAYFVIVYHGVGAPGNGIEFKDGLNSTLNRFTFKLMSTVQLTSSKGYDMHMVMKSATSTSDVSLSQ